VIHPGEPGPGRPSPDRRTLALQWEAVDFGDPLATPPRPAAITVLRSVRAGHANSRTTELVYRHQLRPVMEKGAAAMDQLLGRTA
jgi:integrase